MSESDRRSPITHSQEEWVSRSINHMSGERERPSLYTKEYAESKQSCNHQLATYLSVEK